MKLHIPNSAFLANLDPFIKSFDPSEPENLEVTSHPLWTSIHPVVLCMIAALGLNVRPENIRLQVEAVTRGYLVRMGLFDMLGLPRPVNINEHASDGRFIPLTQVKSSAELDKFITDMIPILHKGREEALTIGQIISELVRNVLEHSDSKNGAILCAQRHVNKKGKNTIRIGIADTGVGIRKTIGRAHPAPNDLAALKLALWPGITGTTSRPGGTEQNGGAGLFITRAIAHVNRDFFILYSGKAFYKQLTPTTMRIYADPFQGRHSKQGDFPYWQGTVAGIDISLDKTQEFDALLAVIRKAYSSARRTKAPLKKPRFI